jgi:ADP-ribose pyrophosphatase YjhB (NUDIX family)
VREVAEEVGVQLAAASLPVPLAAVNARVRRVDLVYLLDLPTGAKAHQEDDAEVRRVGWFPLHRLPEISDPTAEILRAVRLL